MHKLGIIIFLIVLLGMPFLTANPITDDSIQQQLEHGGKVEAIIVSTDNPAITIQNIQEELSPKNVPVIQETYEALHAAKIILTKPALEQLQQDSSIIGIFEDKIYHIFPDEIIENETKEEIENQTKEEIENQTKEELLSNSKEIFSSSNKSLLLSPQLLPLSTAQDPSIQLSISTATIGANYTRATYNVTGYNITVAILDTGIDYRHPALGGCPTINSTCRTIGGYDYYNDDSDPMDDNGHGTHVAGIIGANGTVTGVAPQVNFLAYKVCSAAGSCPTSSILSGLNAALNTTAKIISISLGGEATPNNGASALSIAVNTAALTKVVVVSAGNNGPSTACISSPGDAENVITVGNSNDQGTIDQSDDTISTSSCSGPSAFGRFDPELVAPGSSITSTYLTNSTATMSGTSMATPHISGAAALLLQYNSSLTPSELRKIFVHTASLITGVHPLTQGTGIINVTKALEYKLAINTTQYDRIELLLTGNSYTTPITITSRENQTQQITLNLTILSDLEEDFLLDSSIAVMNTSFTLEPFAAATINISFTLPSNVTPSIYAGILNVSSNSSGSYHVPIVITKLAADDTTISATVDKKRSSCASTPCGDKIYYAFNLTNTNVSINVSWINSTDNLNLYLYNTSGSELTSSTLSASSELVSYAPGYSIVWLLIQTINLITDDSDLPYTMTINIGNDTSILSPLNNSLSELGSQITLQAQVTNPLNDNQSLSWKVNNLTIGTNSTATYFPNVSGVYNLTFQVRGNLSNISLTHFVNVSDTIPPHIDTLAYTTSLHLERDHNQTIQANITDYSGIIDTNLTYNNTIQTPTCTTINTTAKSCTWIIGTLGLTPANFTLTLLDNATTQHVNSSTFTFVTASCFDGAQNGDETGSDCGGSCNITCSSGSSSSSSSSSSSGGGGGGGGGSSSSKTVKTDVAVQLTTIDESKVGLSNEPDAPSVSQPIAPINENPSHENQEPQIADSNLITQTLDSAENTNALSNGQKVDENSLQNIQNALVGSAIFQSIKANAQNHKIGFFLIFAMVLVLIGFWLHIRFKYGKMTSLFKKR